MADFGTIARPYARAAFDIANEAGAERRPASPFRVSNSRSRAELELVFEEPRVAPALQVLADLGALEATFGLQAQGGPFDALELARALDVLGQESPLPPESYLLALLLGVDEAAAERHVERFNWPRRHLQTRSRLLVILGREPRSDGRRGGAIRDEDLEALEVPARHLLRAAEPTLAGRLDRLERQPPPRRLRGRDVVALGLLPGPAIGRVLDEVAEARADGRVRPASDQALSSPGRLSQLEGAGPSERCEAVRSRADGVILPPLDFLTFPPLVLVNR